MAAPREALRAVALPRSRIALVAGAFFTTAIVAGCYHLAQLAPRRAEVGAPAVYVERCSSCHGESGRGDGMAGRGLPVRPRDFGDADWQRAVSNERIELVIREGGQAAGLSRLMPAHADLTEAEIDALINYIRGVRRRSSRTRHE